MLSFMPTLLRWISLGLAASLLTGCASQRVLRLENRLLEQENVSLQARVLELERSVLDPRTYQREPDLEIIHEFLDRSDYLHTWTPDAPFIHMEFSGSNTLFGVRIQHFAQANILFLTTTDYLKLDDAQDTRSMVLLLIQLAGLNYEMLWGKFQLNPENGEVLLSVELPIADGLGYEAFVSALEHLCQTADRHFPTLERASAGLGL